MKRWGKFYAYHLLKAIYGLKILPRWVIVLLDLLFIAFSSLLGYLLRFNFSVSDVRNFNFLEGISLNIVCSFIAIVITNSYKGIVRHTGIQDAVRISKMLLVSLMLTTSINILAYFGGARNFIPYSVLLISFLASFLFLLNYRLTVKYVFTIYNRRLHRKLNVFIYGAGYTGIITKQVIDSSTHSRVIGFLDEDRSKIGKELNGSTIYSAYPARFESLLHDYQIDEVIITVKELSVNRKNEIVEQCLKNDVKVRVVPSVDKWVKGELNINQIKEINIEDLLERDTIHLENENLKEALEGKRICITGAAGSIGSEIVRQVLAFKPHSLILIDQAESPLFEIDREVRQLQHGIPVHPFIADITNKVRIEEIFKNYRPEIVFHAAAYKHVPMMESNPYEAITCNILGTRNLADLSVHYGAEKFVMVSTDKAVNPTNVMGCSKRIAEIYVQSLNKHLDSTGSAHTAFVTTRFGNVMGSNGSVIPLFRKQIEQGGPITVTHPEITRYFMTIPEACRLVLEAGVMGNGGEIFIFDMGESVKILDLARKMVLLSGLKPGVDIDIVFTGLREGEKLYEELLNQEENTLKTHHEKIMIAKVAASDYVEIDRCIDLFHDLIHDKNELKMVTLMKELVPEFVSNYSRYEILDRRKVRNE